MDRSYKKPLHHECLCMHKAKLLSSGFEFTALFHLKGSTNKLKTMKYKADIFVIYFECKKIDLSK